jgi:hypothetical protein
MKGTPRVLGWTFIDPVATVSRFSFPEPSSTKTLGLTSRLVRPWRLNAVPLQTQALLYFLVDDLK